MLRIFDEEGIIIKNVIFLTSIVRDTIYDTEYKAYRVFDDGELISGSIWSSQILQLSRKVVNLTQ